jgi:hypothetical protein
MILNIFNGLVLGLSIKLGSIAILKITEFLRLQAILNGILTDSSGVPTLLGSYFGLSIIVVSIATSWLYAAYSQRELYRSKERRLSNRTGLLVITSSLFLIWASSIGHYPNLSFLWAISLLKPDTIAVIGGYPINLLAITALSVYISYVILLCNKRKSVSPALHLSAAFCFFLLSYNNSSGFYLFWLIQSLSLVYLTKKMPPIIEPLK